MTRRTSLLVLAALIAALSFARAAAAGDAALAEALFRQGRELMDKGDFAAACPKLKESFAQDEATGTLLALALCQERAGQTASAWASYAAVVGRARREGRADREQAALEQMQSLEPKLSRLTIQVDPTLASVPGTVVKRNGLPIGAGAWGVASPVDPGEHRIEVAAPGKLGWTASVTVHPAGDAQVLQVPPLEDAPTPAPPAEPARSPPVAGNPAPPVADASEPPLLRTLGLVVGGAGVVGLGVSAYFAVRAMDLDRESRLNGDCDPNDFCNDAGLAKRNEAIDAARGATIALVAGGVLAAAGVTLLVVDSAKDAKPAATRVEARASAGPGVAGLLVRGRF